MFTSIFIGTSGLVGFAKGLTVIANNTTNLNTVGFKRSSLTFAELMGGGGVSGQGGQIGHGLDTGNASLNFKQGDSRETFADQDVLIDGPGLFIVKDDAGEIHYTRNGHFKFGNDGILVAENGSKVMGLNPDGSLAEISIANARVNVGKPTTDVKFAGNIVDADLPKSISVNVFDTAGGQHALKLTLSKKTAPLTGFNAEIFDGTTLLATGSVDFVGGAVVTSLPVQFNYTPPGLAPMSIKFDFSTNVQNLPTATSPEIGPIAVSGQDGFGVGANTTQKFDKTGQLILQYANGQTVKGLHLALAMFDSIDAVASDGNGQFNATNSNVWHTGTAGVGAFGKITPGSLEISNVDLSQEFSDLVIMQRGYQASSQIISTASEMLQELFSMKGR